MKKLESYLKKTIKEWDETQKVNNLLDVIVLCLNRLPDLEQIDLLQTQSVMSQLESAVRYYNHICWEKLQQEETEINNSIKEKLNLKRELITKISEIKKKYAIESAEVEEMQKIESILTTIDYLFNSLQIDKASFDKLANQLDYYNKLSENYSDIASDLNECQALMDNLKFKLADLIDDKQLIEAKLREVIDEV